MKPVKISTKDKAAKFRNKIKNKVNMKLDQIKEKQKQRAFSKSS